MNNRLDRRRFLQASSSAILAGVGGSLATQMGLAGSALAQSRGGLPGYRALVCVYLAGGNDSFNLLVARDSAAAGSRYSSYRDARGGVFGAGNPTGLALDFNALLDIGTPIGQGHAFGLHPQCADYVLTRNGVAYNYPGLRSLFSSQGKLALVSNIGPLSQPLSMSQFNAGAPRPPQLYSHNDQEALWHAGNTDTNSRTGWGGKLMDRLSIGGNANLPPCISIAGNARFQIGQTISPYQMSAATGVTALANYAGNSTFGDARRIALEELLAQANPHLHSAEYRNIFLRSRGLSGLLSGVLTSAAGRINTPYDYIGSAPNPANNSYSNANIQLFGNDYTNPLLDQLRMVARMIKASRDPSAGINQSRQIYYVRLDGFDTHGTQMVQQPLLMARVSQALGWFWQALGEIGAQNDVTSFTMSDFGRSLSSNGNGSDHGWGGTQMVLGGAVLGGQIYGRHPRMALNANDNVNQDWSFSRGQYIPTTANEQMGASLARWMGLPDAELPLVFPNLANFSGPLSLLS